MGETMRIGVLGGGVMGKGVAYRFAKFGHEVVLVDSDDAVLQRAPAEVRNLMRHDRLASGAAPSSTLLERIAYANSPGALSGCGFVVENITEDRVAKATAYRQLADVLDAEAVVAVNTSTVAIGDLAPVLGNPSRLVGAHFMNPVYLKDTVEMIIGAATSDQTVTFTREVLRSCGMEAIAVRDHAGFVINRVFMVTINEALRCLEEGVADARSIDRLFQDCLGHAMGPLATADLIGLDTIKLSLDRLHEAYGEEKYLPVPLLSDLVERRHLGRKSGAGIFSYEGL